DADADRAPDRGGRRGVPRRARVA
ncbi:MAG: hypothetical protein AVDCRST_MAG11-3076, partial [uncultured Gemmatimonadaceae bacterium]